MPVESHSNFDDEFLSVEASPPSPPRSPPSPSSRRSAKKSKKKKLTRKRGKSGLTEVAEQRLTGRAIRNGWLKERFPVSETIEAIKNKPKSELTAAELALKTAVDGCDNKRDPRVRQRAAKNIIDMVKVNQVDEIKEVPPTPVGVGVNINVSGASGGGINGDGSASASVESSGPKVVLYLPENGR